MNNNISSVNWVNNSLIGKLNRILEKKIDSFDDTDKEILKNLSVEISQNYLQSINQDDYETAIKMSSIIQRYARQMKSQVSSINEVYYEVGFFCGQYATYKKIISNQNDEQMFINNMNKICCRKGINELIEYLFFHNSNYVQHKVLCDYFKIKANLLNKRIEPLVDVGCVIKLAEGKYSLYKLSNSGRKYAKYYLQIVEKEIIDIEEEVLYSYEAVSKNSQELNISFQYNVQDEKKYIRRNSNERVYSVIGESNERIPGMGRELSEFSNIY